MSRLFLVFTILIFVALSRSEYSPSDVPNPMLNPAACGRPDVPRSAICDPALLLKKENKDVIEGFINAAVGVQISVVVIDEMKSRFIGSDDIMEASERFARTLHDTWGVGDKSTNNGVLIFLSVNDRSVYISTGLGVQSKLTRRYIDYLIVEMRPDLRQKEYGTALEKTVVQIDLIMSDKSNIAERYKESETGSTVPVILMILGFCGISGLMIYEKRKFDHLKKGRQALENFMREIDEASENENFKSESCPICLERFPSSKSSLSDPNHMLEGGGGQRGDRGSDGGVEMSHVYSSLHMPYEEGDINDEVSRINEKEREIIETPGDSGMKDREKEKERAKSPLRPMALHCGHVFCFGTF